LQVWWHPTYAHKGTASATGPRWEGAGGGLQGRKGSVWRVVRRGGWEEIGAAIEVLRRGGIWRLLLPPPWVTGRRGVCLCSGVEAWVRKFGSILDFMVAVVQCAPQRLERKLLQLTLGQHWGPGGEGVLTGWGGQMQRRHGVGWWWWCQGTVQAPACSTPPHCSCHWTRSAVNVFDGMNKEVVCCRQGPVCCP
jgi:hypothetical protein